jgi:hypothetical protein
MLHEDASTSVSLLQCITEPEAIDEVVLGYARLSTSQVAAKEVVSIGCLASWTFDGAATRMRWQNQWVKEEKV